MMMCIAILFYFSVKVSIFLRLRSIKIQSFNIHSNAGTLLDKKNITQRINAFCHNVRCICLFGVLKMVTMELLI